MGLVIIIFFLILFTGYRTGLVVSPKLLVIVIVRQTLKVNNPKCYYNARGEELLRKSGLTYTIIRVEGFNNLPGGIQAIEIKQARYKLAYVTVVFCLFFPRGAGIPPELLEAALQLQTGRGQQGNARTSTTPKNL